MDQNTRITFIGGGNMAQAIIGGLVKQGLITPSQMRVSEPWAVAREKLTSAFPGIQLTTSNTDAFYLQSPGNDLPTHVVILAVKPQVMRAVAQEIAPLVKRVNPLIITIAAGIRLSDLSKWTSFEGHVPLCVRCMPNTPALLNEGASGLYASEHVNQTLRELAFAIIASVSKRTYWVEREVLLDVVTGLSGSGPAYFFLMVEAMIKAGVDQGLPEEVARGLAIQTCLGAGQMLAAPDAPDAAQLRKNVTSPNGTTEAALNYFAAAQFPEIVGKAVETASKRATELGETLASSL